MKVLFQLVGGQNVPVYTAYRLIEPEKSIYFYSQDSKNSLKSLKTVINRESEDYLIEAYEIEKTMKIIEELATKYINDDIYMNFTAGTKFMALAAYEVFNKLRKPLIYIESEKMFYYKIQKDNEIKKIPFEQIKISPKSYFQLHGHEINDSFSADSYSQKSNYTKVAEYLMKNYNKHKGSILDFSYHFDKLEENAIVRYPSQGNNSKIQATWVNGKFSIDFNFDEKLSYENITDIEFVNFIRGKWFEYVCYKKINELNIFDKLKINIGIKWNNPRPNSDKYPKNEIDIVGMKSIYPYIFECKSGKIDQDVVNPLQYIKNNYLARYSDFYLIYLKKPSNAIIEKMDTAKIKYLHYDELERLKEDVTKTHPNI
jgi:hypothetical protein